MKKQLLLYLITLILIPTFVVSIIYKSLDNKEKLEIKKTTITKKQKTENLDSKVKVKINKNNEIKELSLEEYIVGVVAGEMPASFEMEALKAQAIASRTYAMYKINNSSNEYDVNTTIDDQVYLTKEEMQTKWLEDYKMYYEKIKKAVLDTKNIVMKKDNKIFKSFFFAMSNGQTEDSLTVFGETGIESVSSPWDNESINKFKVTTEFKFDEIKDKLNLKEINKIEIISRDKTNRVDKVMINNKTYTGIELRKILNLRSTDFEIETENNTCYITTKGYGHGVGMSQYGANGMAKENYNYKEILKHYYQDIEITTI